MSDHFMPHNFNCKSATCVEEGEVMEGETASGAHSHTHSPWVSPQCFRRGCRQSQQAVPEATPASPGSSANRVFVFPG